MRKQKNRYWWLWYLLAYVLACYASLIPNYFIKWGGPPPDTVDTQATWLDHTAGFVLQPVVEPLYLYFTIRLSFAWGLNVLPEGLIPAGVFIVTLVVLLLVARHINKGTKTLDT